MGGSSSSSSKDRLARTCERSLEHPDKVYTFCRFYTPEELHCGRLESHGEREVFESNLSDENEIACVRTPQTLSPRVDVDDACGPYSEMRLHRDGIT